MKNELFILSILGLFLLTSCGGSSGSGTATTMIGTASAVMDKVVPNTTGVSAFVSLEDKIRLADLNTVYADSNMAVGGDFGSTPKGFLQKQGDRTAQSNLMYRFSQSVEQNLCMFNYFLPSTNGVPDVSPATVLTITDSMIASNNGTSLAVACPKVLTSDIPARPFTVRYLVEDISNITGSQYQKKISFDVGNTGTFKSFLYVTVNVVLTKFAYVENSTNSSVCLFEYDSSTKIGKFEFTEVASTFKAFFRAFLDENANLAVFAAKLAGDTYNDVATAVVKTGAANATDLAVSYSFAEANNDSSTVTDANACVSNSTLAIVTNNTLACTSATGAAASTFTTSPTTITSAGILASTYATVIRFSNATDMMTSAIAP